MGQIGSVTKRWHFADGYDGDPGVLSPLGLPPAVVRLLLKRGFRDVGTAARFLNPSLDMLADPLSIPSMDTVVGRLLKAIDDFEPIVVYGDYDADGITSTVLLRSALEGLGANVSHHLPNRITEGYGVQAEVLKDLALAGTGLVVTVDTGISCKAEVNLAAELGMDVIITDHHELPNEIPDSALAIINPKMGGWPGESQLLSGVGVAYKVVQALHKVKGVDPRLTASYLDLAAIGTIADVVPLLGENRVIVKYGLEALAKTNRTGLIELMKVSNIDQSSIDAYHVGFILAPRINAAGRLSDPGIAADLLLTDDKSAAERLAGILDEENRQRQSKESDILEDAVKQAEAYPGGTEAPAFVLASPEWHPGIIGIVASRLVDRFHRPVIMLSVGEGEAKGSGRSIPGLHLADTLAYCSHMLLKHGGHEYAAGLSIKNGQIGEFREAFIKIASEKLSPEDLVPRLDIDDELTAGEITMNLAKQLNLLAPFGTGNSKPVFALRGLWPSGLAYVGANKNHLKLRLKTRGLEADAIGFNMGPDRLPLPEEPVPLDAAFNLDVNAWNGRESVRLGLKDIRPSSSGAEGQDQGGASAAGISRLYGRLSIHDRRGAADKKEALKFILESGEPAVVYLKGDKLVADLAGALVREWPHKKGRIAYYHQGLETGPISKALASGDIDILVANCPMPAGCYYPGLRNVILYHLCGTYMELRSLLSMAAGSSQVVLHLLFGEKDASRQLDLARAVGYNDSNDYFEGSAKFVKDMRELDAEKLMARLWIEGSSSAGR